jgi:hypothetical protein
MALASIAVLSIILYVPLVSKQFAFARPTPMLMLVGLAVVLVSALWFEGVKRFLNAKATNSKLRSP